MATFRGLLRLRPFLPRRFWLLFWKHHWNSYWRTEVELQRQVLKERAPQKIAESERALLTEAIAEEYPFINLLEVGCAYGQLFHTIAPLLPEIKMVGIDPDKERVDGARSVLASAGLKNVTVQIGRAEDLSAFPDNSFDLIVTSASLLYIEPNSIERTMHGFLRVGRKKLLFLEQHVDDEKAVLGIRGPASPDELPYWLRDYRRLLKLFMPAAKVTIEPVTNPLWVSERWQQHGCLITADLR